jgi:hypothetical protein
VQGNYTTVLERLENSAVRNDVLIPGVDQAVLKKKLVRTGNAFFRRGSERGLPPARLTVLVRAPHTQTQGLFGQPQVRVFTHPSCLCVCTCTYGERRRSSACTSTPSRRWCGH